MFCQMCGYKLEEGQFNCPNCGALSPVASAASPSPQEMVPEVPAPPVAEEPVIQETPVMEEEPVIQETPVMEEEPVMPEAPTAAEEPVVQETPTTLEEPVVQETPATFEEPVIQEAPTAVEEPVMPETPAQQDFSFQGEPVQQGFASQEDTMQQGFAPQGDTMQQGFVPQGDTMQQGFAPQGDTMQQGFAPQGGSTQQGFAPQGMPMQQGFAGGMPGVVPTQKKTPIIPIIAAAVALVVVIAGALTFGHFKFGWFVAYNEYQYGTNYQYLSWYMKKTHSSIKPKNYEIVGDYAYTILRYKDSSKDGGYGYVVSDSPGISDKGDEGKYEPYELTIDENYSTNGRIVTKLKDSDGDEIRVAADTNGRVLATYDGRYETYTFYAYKDGRVGEKLYVYDTEDEDINEFTEYAYVNDHMADIDAYKNIFKYDSRGSITEVYYGDESEDDGHWVYNYSFTGKIENAEYISADPDDADEKLTVQYTLEKDKVKEYTYDYVSDDDTGHYKYSYTYNADGTTTIKIIED